MRANRTDGYFIVQKSLKFFESFWRFEKWEKHNFKSFSLATMHTGYNYIRNIF